MEPQGMFDKVQDFYARYRPPVTDEVADRVLQMAGPVANKGALLDLGTGTGQVVVAMARHFKEVLAVELDKGMLRKAAEIWDLKMEKGETSVRWIQADVEEFAPSTDDNITLITACRAFHWMNQAAVLNRYSQHLPSGASFAVFGDSSFWESSQDWAREVKRTVQDYLGEKRKARSGNFSHHKRPYAEIVAESPFSKVKESRVELTRSWTVDQVIGYLYSTTFASRELFGARRKDFEDCLTDRLNPFESDGKLSESATFTIVVGTKP